MFKRSANFQSPSYSIPILFSSPFSQVVTASLLWCTFVCNVACFKKTRDFAFKNCFKETVKIMQLHFLVEQSLMGLGGRGSLITEAGKQIHRTWLATHSLSLECTQLRSPQKHGSCSEARRRKDNISLGRVIWHFNIEVLVLPSGLYAKLQKPELYPSPWAVDRNLALTLMDFLYVCQKVRTTKPVLEMATYILRMSSCWQMEDRKSNQFFHVL